MSDPSEIKYVLGRINWSHRPNEITVLRSPPGGRSSSDVFECRIQCRNQEFLKIVKIGSVADLKREYTGFHNINSPNSLFARIEETTPGVRDELQTMPGEREAIVYAHVKQWIPSENPMRFEDKARLAVINGGLELENTIQSIETLFKGIYNNLYQDFHIFEGNTSELWNLGLGPDGIIQVEEMIGHQPNDFLLKVRGSTEQLPKVYPADIIPTETWKHGEVKPGDQFHLIGKLRAKWHGDRLMGCYADSGLPQFLRFEIVGKDRSICDIAQGLTEGSSFGIYGKLKSIRAVAYKEHLLSTLGELQIEDGVIRGPCATISDPFRRLPEIWPQRTLTITSLVHGDLNPRNIVVTEKGQPCLIDYALTGKGKPLLSDFTRLEGSLARDILPHDINWQQHVRLQRLLAAACRLSYVIEEEKIIENFTTLLTQERQELASAFRLFYTIRKKSKDAYPEAERDHWYRDYLQQLYFFAYLTLKWEKESTPWTLRATAAMAGVASEAMSEKDVYQWWNLDDMRRDGLKIIELLKMNPKLSLTEMVNLAKGIDFWKKRR